MVLFYKCRNVHQSSVIEDSGDCRGLSRGMKPHDFSIAVRSLSHLVLIQIVQHIIIIPWGHLCDRTAILRNA